MNFIIEKGNSFTHFTCLSLHPCLFDPVLQSEQNVIKYTTTVVENKLAFEEFKFAFLGALILPQKAL